MLNFFTTKLTLTREISKNSQNPISFSQNTQKSFQFQKTTTGSQHAVATQSSRMEVARRWQSHEGGSPVARPSRAAKPIRISGRKVHHPAIQVARLHSGRGVHTGFKKKPKPVLTETSFLCQRPNRFWPKTGSIPQKSKPVKPV